MKNDRLNCASLIFLAAFYISSCVAERIASAQSHADSTRSQFAVEFDAGAIVSLRRAGDTFDTQYIHERGRLGDVFIRYRQAGRDWQSVNTAELAVSESVDGFLSPDGTQCEATYWLPNRAAAAFTLNVRYLIEQRAVRWQLELRNAGKTPLEIGDLAIPLPMNSQFRRDRPPTSAVLKHSFISGHGSFLFWMRPNSVGPYLSMTPSSETKLEYWDTSSESGQSSRRRAFRVYIHSTAAGEDAKAHGCNWRQPSTSLILAPVGDSGDSQSYGFKLRWADDYDGVRQILVDEGLVDVHVVPGMTVPSDLSAQIALRTNAPITAVEAEYPSETAVESIGRNGDYELYHVKFARLGENRLKVRFGEDRHMFLEFFATEPIETLIKKRAAFIARCQHRDPTKWYDGLITDWNMESHVLLSPDDYDRISGFRIYAVTCDDPGLCKPAFLAAKNAEYPVQSEVSALDYYIRHFVWGGLQRTTEESYSYGIYGIQDWRRNRESDDPGRDGRLHIWRVYDYPHIVLMYFNMYRIARQFPQIDTRLTANEYLTRAYGTAQAMFTVPFQIEKWSANGTGFYNELVIVDLIGELEAAGMHAEAERLRGHWERKVEYFVNGKADLFVSEYPFDSTGFESTHALAKYAVEHSGLHGERALRFSLQDARRFMDTQIAANIFCRGYLEPAYYYLGSDYRAGAGNAYTLSYMSQMGGWSVLDYALNFASDPAPYLRLGYASYLSAWALMNSGTPESDYGYWYPGPENDGAAGGGFEPAPYGRTWLGQPHHRGSWYYACEIDLGYCGALRTATTVLADDPIFGRLCYGGDWRISPEGISVIPKDGLRRRLHALLNTSKFHMSVDSDRFAAGQPIVLREDLSRVCFTLESDNPLQHVTRIKMTAPAAGPYVVKSDGEPIATVNVDEQLETVIKIPFPPGAKRHKISVGKVLPESGD